MKITWARVRVKVCVGRGAGMECGGWDFAEMWRSDAAPLRGKSTPEVRLQTRKGAGMKASATRACRAKRPTPTRKNMRLWWLLEVE